MNKVYIIGGAQTDFERNWTKEGKGMIALLKEVVADAINSSDLINGREDARREAWEHIGDSASLATEYLINKHQELFPEQSGDLLDSNELQLCYSFLEAKGLIQEYNDYKNMK